MDRRALIITAFGALLITVAGAVFSYREAKEQERAAADAAPLFDYEVRYTADGYEPDRLDIPIGSRVAFQNVSDIPMWTASDPHPIHSDFSVFDSRRAYLPGETYIFQFTETGTFGFHNHDKSIHRGIIRVADPDNPAPVIDKTKESHRATRDELLTLLDASDPNSVFTLIDAIDGNYTLSRDCHDIAHDLGHRAYEMFGFSGAMTFNNPDRLSHTSVDDMCAGGYMHGILEEVFLHQPELEKNPGAICVSIPEDNRGSCFHGVGHGLMFIHKRDATASLAVCRDLGEMMDMVRCFEGVWMELFWGNTDHAGADSLGWTEERPLVPCQNAKPDEKPACFLYAHLGYLRTHPRDFTGAVRLCTGSGLSSSDTNFCLKGIGITMMKHFTSHRLAETERLVDGLDADKKYAYYLGVVGYARLSAVSDGELYRFCGALKNDADLCTAVLKNVPR